MTSHEIAKHGFVTVIVGLLCLITSCSFENGKRSSVEELTAVSLMSLDSVIANHDRDILKKELRLDSIRLKAQLATDKQKKYELYNQIYSEYYSYDLDSAISYAVRKNEIARMLGNHHAEAVSNLDHARMLLAQGHVYKAIDIATLATSDTTDLFVKRQWYDFMASYEASFGRNPLLWHERLSQLLTPNSPEWIYNECNRLWRKGNLAQAENLLNRSKEYIPTDTHNQAITLYLLGEIAMQRRDTVEALRHITLSAINDLKTPVRDYKSLYKLASLLLASGDIERAYRYIDLAVEDANAAKVYDNIIAANRIMPQIVRAHDRQVEIESRAHWWFTNGMTLLAIGLVLALSLTIRSRNLVKSSVSREKELNNRLREINSELEQMNHRIIENNKVKDAYLVQYFNLCSYFVGRFEEFRGSISATVRSKGLAGVEKLIAASDDDRELKKFYSNFDSTFLSLFPDFIEKFNQLLVEDKRITLNRDGSMSNEVRTFALIRLGVVDSEQIAKFLRRSVTTIYNYRVKMRNAASGPRDDFENRVMRI